MARTQLSERAKAMATAAGWKLRHIQINHPDGTGQLVCQDADGRTLMLNGTWTMDPLQAGGWNYAASVGKNNAATLHCRRRLAGMTVLAAAVEVQGPTYSRKSSVPITAGTLSEEHDSHHISLPPINPLAIVQAPAEDEDTSTTLKISVLDDNNQASPITAEQVSGGLGAQGATVFDRVPDPSPILQDQHGILVVVVHLTTLRVAHQRSLLLSKQIVSEHLARSSGAGGGEGDDTSSNKEDRTTHDANACQSPPRIPQSQLV